MIEGLETMINKWFRNERQNVHKRMYRNINLPQHC